MSIFGNTAKKTKQNLIATALSFGIVGLAGCAGGSYNNCPGYPAYPYAAPGQYQQVLPYGSQPQTLAPPAVSMPAAVPQGSVMPQNTMVPQANLTAPTNNIAGTAALPYGYPIGTDLTRVPPQLVTQAPGTVPANAYQPSAYTASVPYPNTDASTRPLIDFR